MEFRKRKMGSVVVAWLSGDLDSRSAPWVQENLLPLVTLNHRVLIDLSGVPYMSSAGVRTMLLVYRQAQCLDHAVGLVGVSLELRNLMAATGFLDFFVTRDTIAAGIHALETGEREVSSEPIPRP